MPGDPEGMLVDWQRRVEQQTALTTELSQRMEQNRATVESRGGEAVVTVDSSGGMAELRLSDQAMRLPADELASIILDTSRRAQAKMAQQMVAVVSSLYGAGSETASFIGGAYTKQFPEPPEDEERDHR
ncbi:MULTISPECIES: YbaB/EbfC family nucleoid-associated protein [unclassified Plantactinospora]|uniref:YbaB/EbfC family nucleoid-associated protein n=1 Tax=unclassified Plantactinospora TaxID=2631981 RepID=UPI002980CCBF|nr:YbaB/EbfC family nucleoid-associated protein [Plantactinospora sp. KLBMP9567]MDW5330784.1 YbaB/EbfC family nucleoid-associated protein [Plantactinospora sp. KLBMP9567]